MDLGGVREQCMQIGSNETSRREKAARAHIEAIYGTPGDEFGATLFVSHHLSEVDASYWKKHTGTGQPEARQVLRLLELRIDPDEEVSEPPETLDFSLPGGVTNYVVCVEFDSSGRAVTVSMES